MRRFRVVFIAPVLAAIAVWAVAPLSVAAGQAPRQEARPAAVSLPRTADGKPDFGGIWQARSRASYDLLDHAASFGRPAGIGVVEGNDIPYQPWAAAKKRENAQNSKTADPLNKCYMPGVPRIMYLEFPFQIFQTPGSIAMTFEWTHLYRLIYLNGTPHWKGIQFWMGDSRGHWEGDTLVVEVIDNNDKTWFDMAGNFHSEAMRLVERYTLTDPDTIQYTVTVEDPKVFTRPWTMSMPLMRQKGLTRILEYHCQAEAEEANGAFERDDRTWYKKP